ncbi:MAG: DUF3256 family protein [Bacteroidaceae bacterium]|nr:DUF3256 family protein [Bacteroidaceae bacterium]MBP5731610.1 DUF3256 family protein [Bacteroidaceae bacterium]
MRNYVRTIVFVLLASLGLQDGEARVMKDFFIAMPDSLMPMLDANARKDLVDICMSGMSTALPNEWDGTSMMQKLTDTFLQLREDSEGLVTTRMALITHGRDTVICVVRTLSTPQPTSELQFFNSQWQEQNVEHFIKLPSLTEFLRDEEKLPEGILPVEFMQADLQTNERGGATLTFSTNTSSNVISFRWKGKKFLRVKE